jgi:hypothetical protein
MLASIPAGRNGKLGQQVLDTGIFKPEEVNCDLLNQKMKKRIKPFEHQKKILGVHHLTAFQVESRLKIT